MISVCMATYNGEKYIKQQLDSILSQLSEVDEVIISDDNSNDKTMDVIRAIDDSRIKIYLNKGRHNYTSNFENALNHANGDIIILSDQDDVWRDDKIKVVSEDLMEFDFVTSDAIIVDQELNIIAPSFWALRKPLFSAWGDLYRCGYLGCCMAFRRNVLQKALPFPANKKLCVHDLWLQLIGSFYFNVKYEKLPLILYRRHGDNVSGAGMDKGVSFVMKIIYRLYVLYKLALRWNK